MIKVPSLSGVRERVRMIPSWVIVLSVSAVVGATAAVMSSMMLARSRSRPPFAVPSEEVSSH